ncbi:hypothetical protein LCGC14_1354360 [marine sediment metagenome]|uniref:Uncharacterized protein n=1 Tax=marine sediment metagenome TaxID=412755 RepID=A0A0F9NC87_9ZZZZ
MYKDKEKQKEANREAMRRKRQGITKTEPVIPNVLSSVIPEGSAGTPDSGHATTIPNFGQPKAIEPGVQAIWDRRNAQGQAACYSRDARPEDYPQLQRPMC